MSRIFPSELLHAILVGKNTEAIAIINDNRSLILRVDPLIGTLLNFATSCRNIAIIKKLIELGTDVNVVEPHQSTTLALHLQKCIHSHPNFTIIRLLVRGGTRLDIAGPGSLSASEAILTLLEHNSKKMYKILGEIINALADTYLPLFPANLSKVLKKNSFTFPHLVYSGRIEILQVMLHEDRNINDRDDTGRTAMQNVCAIGDLKLCHWMLQQGALLHIGSHNSMHIDPISR